MKLNDIEEEEAKIKYQEWFDSLTEGKQRLEVNRREQQEWYDSLSDLRKREVIGHLQYGRFFDDDWCTFSGFYSGDEYVDYESMPVSSTYGYNSINREDNNE